MCSCLDQRAMNGLSIRPRSVETISALARELQLHSIEGFFSTLICCRSFLWLQTEGAAKYACPSIFALTKETEN